MKSRRPRLHIEVLAGIDEREFDEIVDEAAADPIHDWNPDRRSSRETKSVLNILDQLDREASTR